MIGSHGEGCPSALPSHRTAVDLGKIGDLAEVVEKVRKLKEILAKGAPVPDDRLTVGTFLDRWLLHLPGHVSDGTLDDYEDTVRLHLKPGSGRHKLTKLTVAQVDALWQAKRMAGYKANSIRITRAVLRKAIGQAGSVRA
ncbi:hypothetical protein ABGB18_34920 [Nonomuraea sp. B12E4]|uniref:hypothetical protein n=1 Tax=Nonomuraea sp. B12E4 TaxID=3153564 RepID=UPI00325DDA28